MACRTPDAEQTGTVGVIVPGQHRDRFQLGQTPGARAGNVRMDSLRSTLLTHTSTSTLHHGAPVLAMHSVA
jgi:hypothetical protein